MFLTCLKAPLWQGPRVSSQTHLHQCPLNFPEVLEDSDSDHLNRQDPSEPDLGVWPWVTSSGPGVTLHRRPGGHACFSFIPRNSDFALKTRNVQCPFSLLSSYLKAKLGSVYGVENSVPTVSPGYGPQLSHLRGRMAAAVRLCLEEPVRTWRWEQTAQGPSPGDGSPSPHARLGAWSSVV